MWRRTLVFAVLTLAACSDDLGDEAPGLLPGPDAAADVTIDPRDSSVSETGTAADATLDAGSEASDASDATVDASDATVEASDATADASDATADASDAMTDAGDAMTDASDAMAEAGDGAVADPTRAILATKSAACLACAQTNCSMELDGCKTIAGNATAGPAAGTSRSDLCVETLACVVPSSCAAVSGATCYCGTASGAGCLTAGAANGVCKSQLERSLETTDPATIATSFGDDTRGGGRAMLLVTCLSDNACASCF
jgi:hypothetical protein